MGKVLKQEFQFPAGICAEPITRTSLKCGQWAWDLPGWQIYMWDPHLVDPSPKSGTLPKIGVFSPGIGSGAFGFSPWATPTWDSSDFEPLRGEDLQPTWQVNGNAERDCFQGLALGLRMFAATAPEEKVECSERSPVPQSMGNERKHQKPWVTSTTITFNSRDHISNFSKHLQWEAQGYVGSD